MKKLLFFSLVCIAILVSCQQSWPKVFADMAERENAKCPIYIENFLTLDSVKYNIEKNRQSYYYTLSGEYDEPLYIESNKGELKEILLDGIINSIELKAYKDYGTTLEYIYYSKKEHSKEALKISFSKEDYN